MNIRKIRRAQARGKTIKAAVAAESLVHRRGTAMEKSCRVFAKLWPGYVKGEVKRKVLVEKAVKRAEISPATASTYLHNFAQAQA